MPLCTRHVSSSGTASDPDRAAIGLSRCVPIAPPPNQPAGQLVRALATAFTRNEISTVTLGGMPWGQPDGPRLARAIFTKTTKLLTVTLPVPSQSPSHTGPWFAVAVGVAV